LQEAKVFKDKLRDLDGKVGNYLKGVLQFFEIQAKIYNIDTSKYDPFVGPGDSDLDNQTYIQEIEGLMKQINETLNPGNFFPNKTG
jgi:hypothetical protein